MKKLSTTIFLVFITLAMLGYLYYGWLLFQTLTSETSPGVTIEFAIRFVLWLLPFLGFIIFIVIWGVETEKKRKKNRM